MLGEVREILICAKKYGLVADPDREEVRHGTVLIDGLIWCDKKKAWCLPDYWNEDPDECTTCPYERI